MIAKQKAASFSRKGRAEGRSERTFGSLPKMRVRSKLVVLALPLSLAAAFGAACSSSTTPEVTADAAAEAGGTPDAFVEPTEVRQTGRALVLQQRTPVEGATVTAGTTSTTTNANGDYSLIVPRGKPVRLTFAAPEFYKLVEQEYVVEKATYERGESLMLSRQTAGLLKAFLPGLDTAKGILVVRVVAGEGCKSEEGTELSLDPPGATLRYTVNGLPSDKPFVTAGENNGAIFYNVTPGAKVTVTAKSPTCSQLPFPVAFEGVKYNDNQTTEGGESFTFMRVFLGTKVQAPDAGPVDAGAGDAAPSDAGDAATD